MDMCLIMDVCSYIKPKELGWARTQEFGPKPANELLT